MILWDCFTYFCLKAKQQRGKEKGVDVAREGERETEWIGEGTAAERWFSTCYFTSSNGHNSWRWTRSQPGAPSGSALLEVKRTILGHLPSSPRYINRSLNWKYKVARSNKGCNHLKWWLNLLCHNCPVVYRSNSSHFYIPISPEVHICHSGDKMECLLEFTDCLVGM